MNDDIITALLVEDDQRLAQLTSDYLGRHAVLVTRVSDGRRAVDEAARTRFDVVLLDLMLPGLDGVAVCRELRQRTDVPIIMLTARGEEADRVLGLEMGADDYMVKPFSPRELLARIRSLLRRTRGQAGPRREPASVGALEVDLATHRATLRGAVLDVTSYELALLFALVKNAGRVLSRDQLMELAAGTATEAFDRSIDVHVSRLRQKLGDDARRPRYIRTVRGIGYLMALDPEGTP